MNKILKSKYPAIGLIAACALALSSSALAWTNKPVKMIVPAPAGGTMDIVARVVAEQLGQELGQSVVVENKPGAGGAIAVQALIAAPGDGQTIMMTASNVLTEIPHVMKTGFDPMKDVEPVALIVKASAVLVSAPSVPAKDFSELVAYAKAKPGQLSFASYSTGTISHYAGMILNQKAGLDLQHVPYPGSPPALTQVMAGQPLMMFDGLATSLPLVNSGKLKAYGVLSKTRSSHLPNVPTMAEQGYPELDFSNWIGVIVEAGVPAATRDAMNTALAAVAKSPKVRDRLVAAGFEAVENQTPAQMSKAMKADFERNAAIVKTFNIKLN